MDLAKLALLTAVLGTFLLIFLSTTLEPKQMKISEINEKMIDEYVKISVEVVKEKHYDCMVLLTVEDDTESIKVIAYKDFNASGTIEVIGKIKNYKGILEIEAEKIQQIN